MGKKAPSCDHLKRYYNGVTRFLLNEKKGGRRKISHDRKRCFSNINYFHNLTEKKFQNNNLLCNFVEFYLCVLSMQHVTSIRFLRIHCKFSKTLQLSLIFKIRCFYRHNISKERVMIRTITM